ncbi:hypothetical protein BO94DRAFT_619525 [Aspergillus sclerotioniger CBS 115572]|uniref:Regulator of volume decrease after cellular swelling-domain-containing protein n=1 Tax=Aspergillus sclerotioniger CBS 115572 TaxID=1450535 RepID=A0A317XH36_9EURO|nr:hypothetical protein BO94DRAFT_619525 [Aspergillus sclerotioniger CBS 115572]PWY96390.1 hypothetical protein BO94DRAFT_619525 [Aspergillus sclerotioniger CBS 115572]
MEPLTTPPDTTTFIPLAEHQSRTPSSFHSGPAVLYSHHQNCKLVILERDLLAVPALGALRDSPATANGTSTTTSDEETEVVIQGVNVWVTSEKFLLHNPTTNTGLSIPYPTIHLHAIQRLQLPSSPGEEVQGLYMQLAHPSPQNYTSGDDEEEILTITIVPGPATQSQEEEDEKDETPTQTLYAAVSACSNLHPDPVEPGDEDEDDEEEGGLLQTGLVSMGSTEAGGLPPPVEGSSGWITAENMHEFFDEEGNWIAGGEEPNLSLGPGAGTVRHREDGEEGGEGEG